MIKFLPRLVLFAAGFVALTPTLALAQSTSAQPTEPRTIFIKCGRLLDGKSDQARTNIVLAIAGDKVSEVGTAAAKGEVIDLSRETCLPGLIDTHTHVLLQGDITAADYDAQLLKQSPEYRTILATVNARRALEYGFTTIRDLGTEGAGYADVDVKKAINNGVISGPRMNVATRAMSITAPYPLAAYATTVPASP